MKRAVIIALFLTATVALFATPLTSKTIDTHVTIGRDGTNFIATIESICQDPFEGWWIKCLTGETHVLIFAEYVRDLEIGCKYRVLCTRLGAKRYRDVGEIDVYESIMWEVVE